MFRKLHTAWVLTRISILQTAFRNILICRQQSMAKKERLENDGLVKQNNKILLTEIVCVEL